MPVHISNYVKNHLKAEFDSDFGDIQREMKNPKTDSGVGVVRKRWGLHATQRNPNRPKKRHCAVSLKQGLRHVTFARYSVFLTSYW